MLKTFDFPMFGYQAAKDENEMWQKVMLMHCTDFCRWVQLKENLQSSRWEKNPQKCKSDLEFLEMNLN